MSTDILIQIASDRAERVSREGAAQGLLLPPRRQLPLVPFAAAHGGGSPGILIAELKRKSPSKGSIAEIPDPALLAERFQADGFRRVSVLTEENRFGGSLADLVKVKTAHPRLSVLRKDFLLTVEDIDISWRAGADAVLLIATLLEAHQLELMYRRASELGLECLVEVHDWSDAAKVRRLAPPLVGINSRDLRRFKVEPLLPLETRAAIDWDCDVIYESGIHAVSDALFVRGCGFSGFLVGEAVAKNPELAGKLIGAWNNAGEANRMYAAWKRLYSRYEECRPLVKICGITNRNDALAAVAAGADMLGFVLAESPRRTTPDIIRGCADIPAMKAAVVVLAEGEDLPGEIAELLAEGALDFIQFHGDESAETVQKWPGYKALRLASPADATLMDKAGSPAVLVDAFSSDARGGTGKRLDGTLVTAAARQRRLWLAGGLNPENVADIVTYWKPGLVDVSSGVEAEKGRKDYDKLRAFVRTVKEAAEGQTIGSGNPAESEPELILNAIPNKNEETAL